MARSKARRIAILDAAEALMLEQGLRATSMEAIATRAGIAKPTLYAYFADKPALIAALGDRLLSEAQAALAVGLAGGGDAPQSIGAGLAGLHKAIWRRRALSPHADALFAKPIEALAVSVALTIETKLAAAGVPRARPLARLLLSAVAGVAGATQSAAELGPAIRLLAERLLRPEMPRPKGH